ncbi:MAG: hypothetical protein DMF68_08755 [Acidobacteria bacterium]|nr:MAG: hypothetical protein DMF68_08755 [Acidobacteriota bacterium]
MYCPRVCLISHAYLEKSYRSKLNLLAQEFDLTLVSPDKFPSAYGLHQADFAEDRKYQVEVYPCRFPLGVRTSTRWTLKSRDLSFRQASPDIIHVENEAHSFSLLQALTLRRWYAPQAKIVIFVWANQRLVGLKGHALNGLARLMRSGIDFYISGNSEGRELLIESGVPAEKIAVIPQTGVDIKYYTPASDKERAALRLEIGLRASDLVIGFVGRLVEDKGVLDLLQAFKKLREEMRDERLRLLYVGDGALKPLLTAQGEDVLVASPGDSRKVLPYYRMMDLLVLPSRTLPYWKEQFGRVLVEAMACGLPVIGSDSGAIREVIGDSNQIFAEGNVKMLAAKIKEMLSSASERANLARRGLERVASHYSDEQIAKQTASIYFKLYAKD